MKLVINTQFKENYGAHDWDGKGECPQYWKFKGGDTYVIEVSLAEAQDPSFYDGVAKCIEHSSDYSAEYILYSDLVDEIDFDPSSIVEEWETAIYATYKDGVLSCSKEVIAHDLTNSVVGVRTWLQDENGQRECQLDRFEEAVAV